jgi:CheY-like chemotaxis protein
MEQVRSGGVDLVCLDISMPEESGIRFYRNLKEDPELSGIPVVVVTAVTGYGADPEPFKRFISTRRQVPPPEGFLAKPIDKQEFLDTIARVLS